MFIQHIIGLFTDPVGEWEKIREEQKSKNGGFGFIFILSAIPAISGYIGTTQVGWRIGVGDPVRITGDSAIAIAIIFYLAMIVGVFSIGWVIHLLGKAYELEKPLPLCLALAAYTATPLFLIGIMEVYPVLWLNMLLGLPALAYTVYLLYSGLPVMMEIPAERGFLYSSAVLAVGLIALVSLLGMTALLWGMGLQPVFTS
ncbi:MAG: YIP1 family protein [Gammaproteobacteria bacterium]|nr:MAG: YIP1 family protein [Gammaproteobacteria bacterium]UCH41839.1 MAG: YIP1 family protein [Gammaproteobacteria bacterium]